MGLLSLIPFRDWCYLAAIIALLVGFGIFVHHERFIGEQKILAADAKTVAIQTKHDEDVQNAAKTASQEALAAYVAAHAVPTLPPAHLVCRRPASNSGAMSGDGGSAKGSDANNTAAPVSTGTSEQGFDPGPGVSAVAADADEEIFELRRQNTLLQALIRSYQAAGVVARK